MTKEPLGSLPTQSAGTCPNSQLACACGAKKSPCLRSKLSTGFTMTCLLQRWHRHSGLYSYGFLRRKGVQVVLLLPSSEDPTLLAHLPFRLLFNPESSFPSGRMVLSTLELSLSPYCCLAYFLASQNTLCLTPTHHNLNAHFMEQVDRKCAMGVTQQYSLG